MNAGRLRHRLELQTRATTQDGYGSQSETWTTTATVWAAIEPLIGREFIAAQAVQAETTGKIRIRYLSGVNAAMRGKRGSKIYNFLAVVTPDERNREMVIYTSEGVSNG